MSDLKFQKKSRPAYTVRDLVIDALCIALVLAFTMFVNLRLPLPPTADSSIWAMCLCSSPRIASAAAPARSAAGLGMAAFDLISGWIALGALHARDRRPDGLCRGRVERKV